MDIRSSLRQTAAFAAALAVAFAFGIAATAVVARPSLALSSER